jgi:hypothetical protein
MEIKSLKIPAIIIVIGLVLSLAASLFTNIILTPTVTEHDFNFSITYKLGGETKTLEGVYRCTYEDFAEGQDPGDRYYTGEYTINGQTARSHTYTIAQKDGAELYIVMLFNDCYLMGDKKDMDYEPFLEEPYLEAVDKEGYPYDETNMPSEFTAEIISWEYPEPIENTFVFSGFSILHAGSMLAMLAVGLLTIVACLIFVKKDKSVPYKVLDKLSVLLNFAVCFLAIPFITACTVFMQLTTSTDDPWYQFFLCIPAITAFAVAASIALRRKGYTKTGFCLQFAGPVLFFVPVIVESIIYNFFG